MTIYSSLVLLFLLLGGLFIGAVFVLLRACEEMSCSYGMLDSLRHARRGARCVFAHSGYGLRRTVYCGNEAVGGQLASSPLLFLHQDPGRHQQEN